MRYRLMASFQGAPYQAGIGPSDEEVTLFAACPPPEELGFRSSSGHWRKRVSVDEIDALWEARPIGRYRNERCMVLDDLGDRMHIAYLGRDLYMARRLGFWEVDRGVFEVVVPRQEITDLREERGEYELAVVDPADDGMPGSWDGGHRETWASNPREYGHAPDTGPLRSPVAAPGRDLLDTGPSWATDTRGPPDPAAGTATAGRGGTPTLRTRATRAPGRPYATWIRGTCRNPACSPAAGVAGGLATPVDGKRPTPARGTRVRSPHWRRGRRPAARPRPTRGTPAAGVPARSPTRPPAKRRTPGTPAAGARARSPRRRRERRAMPGPLPGAGAPGMSPARTPRPAQPRRMPGPTAAGAPRPTGTGILHRPMGTGTHRPMGTGIRKGQRALGRTGERPAGSAS